MLNTKVKADFRKSSIFDYFYFLLNFNGVSFRSKPNYLLIFNKLGIVAQLDYLHSYHSFKKQKFYHNQML
jgi:hypothetical protein